MNKSLQQVKEFHELFDHPVGNLSTPESLKTRQLRIKLLFEELAELAEASDCKRTLAELADRYCIELAEKNGGIENTVAEQCEVVKQILDDRDIKDGDNVNKTEELDALCDIQYVLNGKILTSGLHEIFDNAFDTVQANNMSKAHESEDHCTDTICALEGNTIDWREKYNIEKKTLGEDTFYILTNKHGKVIKPHNHVKVKLDINDLVSELDPNFPG
jgi:predicted HAD superfamily Cof-like phosphohydrolase